MRHLLILSVLVSSLVGSGCTSRIDRETARLCQEMGWEECSSTLVYDEGLSDKLKAVVISRVELSEIAQRLNAINAAYIDAEALAAIKAMPPLSKTKFFLGNRVDGKVGLKVFLASDRCWGVPRSEGCVTIHQGPIRLELKIDEGTVAGAKLIKSVQANRSLRSCGLSASGDLRVIPTGDPDSLSAHGEGWFKVDYFSVIPCDTELLSTKLTIYLTKAVETEFALRTSSRVGGVTKWDEWIRLKIEEIAQDIVQ